MKGESVGVTQCERGFCCKSISHLTKHAPDITRRRNQQITQYFRKNTRKFNISAICFDQFELSSVRICKIRSRNHLSFTSKTAALIQFIYYRTKSYIDTLVKPRPCHGSGG
jgi:hypothetical protein